MVAPGVKDGLAKGGRGRSPQERAPEQDSTGGINNDSERIQRTSKDSAKQRRSIKLVVVALVVANGQVEVVVVDAEAFVVNGSRLWGDQNERVGGWTSAQTRPESL